MIPATSLILIIPALVIIAVSIYALAYLLNWALYSFRKFRKKKLIDDKKMEKEYEVRRFFLKSRILSIKSSLEDIWGNDLKQEEKQMIESYSSNLDEYFSAIEADDYQNHIENISNNINLIVDEINAIYQIKAPGLKLRFMELKNKIENARAKSIKDPEILWALITIQDEITQINKKWMEKKLSYTEVSRKLDSSSDEVQILLQSSSYGEDSSLSALDKAYLLLGAEPGDDNETIIKNYHFLRQMYHPDRYSDKSADFIEIAERKFKDLSQAFNLIKKKRNI